jgi:hypothetical protein
VIDRNRLIVPEMEKCFLVDRLDYSGYQTMRSLVGSTSPRFDRNVDRYLPKNPALTGFTYRFFCPGTAPRLCLSRPTAQTLRPRLRAPAGRSGKHPSSIDPSDQNKWKETLESIDGFFGRLV